MAARAAARPSVEGSSWSLRSEYASLRRNASPHLFVATDDDELRTVVCDAGKLLGCHISCLQCGGDALKPGTLLSSGLLLLDQDLRDIPALDLARVLRRNNPMLRFVLIGKNLSVSTTVEAMKLGAFTVLEKPVSWRSIVMICRSALDRSNESTPSSSRADSERARTPRSCAERWALHVLKACDADGDLRTIGRWASYAGLSYSSLCESCRLVGMRPHDARDFARVLRAVVKSGVQGCRVEELLDISDRRTLRSLLTRAGFDANDNPSGISVEQFLASQRFVPRSHAALALLRAHLLRVDM